jgi:hypothetical protein
MDKDNEIIKNKLDTVVDLLQHLLAIELSKSGVDMGEIGKHLHIAKAKVVKMLKGVKKEN